MKKFSTAKLTFALLGILTAACAAGSIGSTLAWYAYATRALVSYSGTSVFSTGSLQIGIASDEKLTEMPSTISEVTFEDEYDQVNDSYAHYYYFAAPGTSLTYEIIANYLSKKDYATNELQPVTSGSYSTGSSSFSLKQSPNETIRGNLTIAPHQHYVSIPFAFRVISEEDNGTITYLPNRELWLSSAIAKASGSGDGEIYKALRVFVDRDDSIYGNNNDFIFNPSANDNGRTRVGGLLELSRDGYYDFDANGEILYGEYDPSALNALSSEGYNGENELHDINGTQNTTHATTFTAKHHPQTKYYSSLNDNLFGHAEYISLGNIAPARDEYDNLSNPVVNNQTVVTSVCKTDANNHNIGRLDMTVYLEGWDFSVIDQEISHKFDLGLTFEISRVQ